MKLSILLESYTDEKFYLLQKKVDNKGRLPKSEQQRLNFLKLVGKYEVIGGKEDFSRPKAGPKLATEKEPGKTRLFLEVNIHDGKIHVFGKGYSEKFPNDSKGYEEAVAFFLQIA